MEVPLVEGFGLLGLGTRFRGYLRGLLALQTLKLGIRMIPNSSNPDAWSFFGGMRLIVNASARPPRLAGLPTVGTCNYRYRYLS